jgi:predicted nuclease of predicted toxin-antitoxin system
LKILLDENFPLPLYHRLRTTGYQVEHVIILGQRGIADSQIRKRVETEDLVLLTQDTEFENISASYRGKVIISRVRQRLPIQQRVDLWFRALQTFMAKPPEQHLFDLLETGEVIPWEIHEAG